MSLSSSKYKKRSWFVAFLLHLIALVLILIGYFIYLYQPNEKSKHVSVDNSHVISADLLSFQQTESVLFNGHQSESTKAQVKLNMTPSGSQASKNKTVDTQKSPQNLKEAQKDESKKKSNAQQNIHQLGTQAQVNHYMASLASYLYQKISKDVNIDHQAEGDIYATISVDGKLSHVHVKLQKPNVALRLAIENIIAEYQPIDTITELDKPIRVRIPFKFN